MHSPNKLVHNNNKFIQHIHVAPVTCVQIYHTIFQNDTKYRYTIKNINRHISS